MNKFSIDENKNNVILASLIFGTILFVSGLWFFGTLVLTGAVFVYMGKINDSFIKKENKYINDNLLPEETIIFLASINPVIFAIPSVLLIINMFVDHYILNPLLTVVTFLFFVDALIDFYTTEFGITDKRIIKKTGWLKRDTVELNYEKIESLNVDQSILGRVFNYGTLNLTGTGGTRSSVKFIENPLEFRKVYIAHITKR